MAERKHGSWLIYFSLVIAMLLTLFPLPDAWVIWRPSWLLLALAFWIISLPYRIGILWAFVCGLLLDVLLGTIMGLHSFSLTLCAFLLQMLHQRLRLFPLWKQALAIGVISSLYLLSNFWLGNLTGKSQTSFYWPAIAMNAILWPWVFLVLRHLRRYFKVQ